MTKGKYFFLFCVRATLLFWVCALPAAVDVDTSSCRLLIEETVNQTVSSERGVALHIEHYGDLVLSQAGETDNREINAFEQVTAILAGRSINQSELSEKFDGSPSIVAGFDSDGIPWVTYKGKFEGKRQVLFRNETDVEGAYGRSEELKHVFNLLVRHLIPHLQKLDRKFHDFIFQGDVLFVEGDQKRTIDDDLIKLEPNSLQYLLPSTDENFVSLKAASVGIVIHTIARRKTGVEGRLVAEPSQQVDLLKEFTELNSDTQLFLRHPMRMAPGVLAESKWNEIFEKTLLIRKSLSGLTGEFRGRWRTTILPEFRVYLNSFLRPPYTGGLFEDIRAGKTVSLEEVIRDFRMWLEVRPNSRVLSLVDFNSKEFHKNFSAVLSAFIYANQIQEILLTSNPALLKSKLGMGPAEGLVLRAEATVVKFVDRLSFTLLNNTKWNRSSRADQLTGERPFADWKDGDAVFVLKGQPLHSGHVALVKKIASSLGGRRLHILASDIEPNLEAKTWQLSKLADTRTEILEGKFKHAFSVGLRRELFQMAFQGLENVKIHFAPVQAIWGFLGEQRRLNPEMRIAYYVSQKEIEADRYKSQVAIYGGTMQLRALPLESDGLSATQVRNAVRILAIGADSDGEATKTVYSAFAYIEDLDLRKAMIERMVEEWKKLLSFKEKFRPPPKKEKPVKSPAVPRKKKTAA